MEADERWFSRGPSGIICRNMMALLAAQTDPDAVAFKIGTIIGSAVPVFFALIGAVWCGALMARPGVNRKGVAALGTVFAVWAFAMILGVLKNAVSGGTLFDFAIGGTVLIGVIVSVVLGIAALVDDGKFVQGK